MASKKAAIPRAADRNQQQPKLNNLIPVAVAIACGCEHCVESAVMRALRRGSPRQDLKETLQIVAYMLNLECLTANAGADAVVRMRDALDAATAALRHAALS